MMHDFNCNFCKEKVKFGETDGVRLFIPNVFGNQAIIEVKKPNKYFPLRCGKCGEETRFWREEK
jgi:transcription elongation factor Elf1